MDATYNFSLGFAQEKSREPERTSLLTAHLPQSSVRLFQRAESLFP
jgi:hypothetical protein